MQQQSDKTMEEKIQVCPYCGRTVSTSDELCPHCGRPVVIKARQASPSMPMRTSPASTAPARTPASAPARTIITPARASVSTPSHSTARAQHKAQDKAPDSKRKRMLHLSILLLLVAIILYGTYELLG